MSESDQSNRISTLPGARGVDLSPFAAPRQQDSVAQRLEAYWLSLMRNGALPRRAEIDPRAIDSALADIFLIERIAPGLARFRVAGRRLSALMNMDVRGMPLSAIIAPAHRDDLARALAALFERPARLRLGLRAAQGIGQPRLRGRMLLLPLRTDDGEIGRAIGCLTLDGAPGRTPRRLEITGCRIEPIGTARPLTSILPGMVTEAPPAPAPQPPTPPRDRPPADPAARPRLRAERPWLRLVVCN